MEFFPDTDKEVLLHAHTDTTVDSRTIYKGKYNKVTLK